MAVSSESIEKAAAAVASKLGIEVSECLRNYVVTQALYDTTGERYTPRDLDELTTATASLLSDVIPAILISRQCPLADEIAEQLLGKLIKFHAPWLLQALSQRGLNLTSHVLGRLLNPWSFSGVRPAEGRSLHKFWEALRDSGQSTALCFIILTGLLHNATELLSARDLPGIRAVLDRWQGAAFGTDPGADETVLEIFWGEAAELASQTPQSFAEEWETCLLRLDASVRRAALAGQPALPKTLGSMSDILTMAAGEPLDILFQRARLRTMIKQGSGNSPSQIVSEAKIHVAFELGIRMARTKGTLDLQAELQRILRTWEIIMIDCRTTEQINKHPTKLRRAIKVDDSVLEPQSTEFAAIKKCEMLLDALVRRMDGARGQLLGFLSDSGFVRKGTAVGDLVYKFIDAGFPKVFVVAGGWPAFGNEIAQMPVEYQRQLTMPTVESGWAEAATRSIRGLAENISAASSGFASMPVTDRVTDAKEFLKKETVNIGSASVVLRKKLNRLWATREDGVSVKLTSDAAAEPGRFKAATSAWWQAAATSLGNYWQGSPDSAVESDAVVITQADESMQRLELGEDFDDDPCDTSKSPHVLSNHAGEARTPLHSPNLSDVPLSQSSVGVSEEKTIQAILQSRLNTEPLPVLEEPLAEEVSLMAATGGTAPTLTFAHNKRGDAVLPINARSMHYRLGDRSHDKPAEIVDPTLHPSEGAMRVDLTVTAPSASAQIKQAEPLEMAPADSSSALVNSTKETGAPATSGGSADHIACSDSDSDDDADDLGDFERRLESQAAAKLAQWK